MKIGDTFITVRIWGRAILGYLPIVTMLALPLPVVQAQDSTGVVRAVLVSCPQCEDFEQVVNHFLPQIFSTYNQQLEILLLDTSLPANREWPARLSKKYGLSQQEFQAPVVIVGKKVLVGKTKIEAQLAKVVDGYLAQGGIGLPFPKLKELRRVYPPTARSLLGISFLLGAVAGVLGVMLIRTRRRVSIVQREAYRMMRARGELDRTLLALVGRAGSSIDLLNESKRILYLEGKRSPEEAASDAVGLASRLISTVKDATGIKPIERYRSTVTFDPARHSSYEEISPSEQVLVLETGWERDKNILKKAVVKRISRS